MSDEFDWTTASDGLVPLPDPNSVFAGNVSEHRKVLLPLVSIPASWVDPSWGGKLHFVTPIEPYDSLLGEETRAFHSGYCQTNWIAFRVQDSKYKFLGDFRYFRINAPFEGPHAAANSQFLKDYYAEVEASFANVKGNYAATGKFQHHKYPSAPQPWLSGFGGDAPAGNWVSFAPKVEIDPATDADEWETAHPLTDDNRRFRFIGEVRGSDFRSNGADAVLLFYDHKTQTALFTFEWT
jgi:hypothetical protein